jgi:very-short-patch-repair endonuclease/predicted transcriptional regulator of viral defense system
MHRNADEQLHDLAAERHGVFTIDDARRAGLTHGQIDRRSKRRWSRLYDGVFRVSGAPTTWRGDLLAAALSAGVGAAISHRAAAAVYELPGGRDDLVELTCRRWERTIHRGLVVHESRRLDERDIRIVDAIPVTSPERTLLDLAWGNQSPNFLEMVAQSARRRRLLTYESTRELFDRHARRGLKGVKAVRIVLDRWDPDSRPTESEMETMLLQTLRRNGLPEPVLQHEVRDDQDHLVARTDAAYPSARIAIEYDSKQEHSDEFQLERDARRRNALQANGYAVLSARHADLRTGGGELCDQIARIMRRTA